MPPPFFFAGRSSSPRFRLLRLGRSSSLSLSPRAPRFAGRSSSRSSSLLFFFAGRSSSSSSELFATGFPVGRPVILGLGLAGSSSAPKGDSTAGSGSGSGAGGGGGGSGAEAFDGGGAAGAPAEGGMTPAHFGHYTARPAYSSLTDSVAEHDGHTKRIGIEKLLRGARAVRRADWVEWSVYTRIVSGTKKAAVTGRCSTTSRRGRTVPSARRCRWR